MGVMGARTVLADKTHICGLIRLTHKFTPAGL